MLCQLPSDCIAQKKTASVASFWGDLQQEQQETETLRKKVWRMANLAMLGMVSNGSDCVYRCFTGWWFGTFIIFPYIGNVIIRTDELIFFRGVGQPPTSKTN
jgi:hypothetical protein